jgi:excisionase family DNA binding protein|tara:strand:- start:4351 stop:4611 length:261 start_codon:yes stop_codon:yes gene_type:complete
MIAIMCYVYLNLFNTINRDKYMKEETKESPVIERLAYSVNEIAQALGVSNQHIFNMIKQDKIKKFKLGRRTLISVKEFNKLISNMV